MNLRGAQSMIRPDGDGYAARPLAVRVPRQPLGDHLGRHRPGPAQHRRASGGSACPRSRATTKDVDEESPPSTPTGRRAGSLLEVRPRARPPARHRPRGGGSTAGAEGANRWPVRGRLGPATGWRHGVQPGRVRRDPTRPAGGRSTPSTGTSPPTRPATSSTTARPRRSWPSRSGGAGAAAAPRGARWGGGEVDGFASTPPGARTGRHQTRCGRGDALHVGHHRAPQGVHRPTTRPSAAGPCRPPRPATCTSAPARCTTRAAVVLASPRGGVGVVLMDGWSP